MMAMRLHEPCKREENVGRWLRVRVGASRSVRPLRIGVLCYSLHLLCFEKEQEVSPCYSPTRLASITALTYNWGGKLFKKKFFSLYTNGLHCKTCGMDSDPSDHVVVVNSSGFLNVYFFQKSLKQYRKFSWLSHAPKKVNPERKQSYFEWKQVLI